MSKACKQSWNGRNKFYKGVFFTQDKSAPFSKTIYYNYNNFVNYCQEKRILYDLFANDWKCFCRFKIGKWKNSWLIENQHKFRLELFEKETWQNAVNSLYCIYSIITGETVDYMK